MIWINVCNIIFEKKFSGIARTEFELCLYAYNLSKQGYNFSFCTFDDRVGFIKLNNTDIEKILYNLKNGIAETKKRPKLKIRLKNSTLKRINKIKIALGIVKHPFQNNDTIISVGQKLGNSEMRSIGFIKKKLQLTLKVLCHDLIPISHPNFFFGKNVQLFFQYIREATRVVDFFYCNSNYTKTELTNYYHKNNLTPPPMQVITLGCDLHNKAKTILGGDSINKLITEPYLLFVSTIEIRKNHQLIYEMYLKLLKQGADNLPKIYFVGRRGWKVDDLLHQLDNDERIQDKIILLNNITDNQLLQLYKNCWFTLYPSFIEGYGLPVAESLSMGKYCLSSNAGSLPEAGGEFIDYLSPYELDSWCEKFLFLINNPDYITQKEQHIKDNYRPVSWEHFAKEILKNELSSEQRTR